MTSRLLLLLLVPLALSFPLEKRIDPPGPLYGSSGRPEFSDVGQTTIPNCGFAAASAALAFVNTNFLTSVITPEGALETANSARFSIYDPETLQVKPVSVSKSELPENAGNKGPIWWPGALEQAAVKNGLSMVAVYPATALSVQTGKKATDPRTRNWIPNSSRAMDKEALWTLIQRAPQTPMVWQTLDGAPGLVGGHAYAVLGSSGAGAERSVRMYNPWGDEKTYNFDLIWPGTYGIHHLADFDHGPGNHTAAPPITKSQQEPTPTPKVQPTDPALHNFAEQGKTSTRTIVNGDTAVVEVVVHKVVYVTA